jgi:hypothetical protein
MYVTSHGACTDSDAALYGRNVDNGSHTSKFHLDLSSPLTLALLSFSALAAIVIVTLLACACVAWLRGRNSKCADVHKCRTTTTSTGGERSALQHTPTEVCSNALHECTSA